MHSKDFPSARIKPNERVRDMDKPSMTNRPDRPVTEKKPLLDGAVDWSKLAFIREHIVGRNYEDCIELTPDQVKTVLSLAEEYERKESKKIKGITIELPREDEQPFLQITLDKYSGVPKVFHKGEEIKGIINISMDWLTNDENGRRLPHIKLVHVEGKGEGACIKNIEYNDIWNELDV